MCVYCELDTDERIRCRNLHPFVYNAPRTTTPAPWPSQKTDSAAVVAAAAAASAGTDTAAGGSGAATQWSPMEAISIYSKSGSATAGGCFGEIIIPNVQAATGPQMFGHFGGHHTGNGTHYSIHGSCRVTAAAGAMDGFRLYFSSGNIDVSSRVSVLVLRG